MFDLISVIIPIYKVEAYLEECIISVVTQSYKNLEIILVDDGSPDRCSQICDEWAKKDSRIKVVHKENGGLSDARNVGIDNASGKYIAFVDSDDYIDQNMLQSLYEAICRTDSDIAACGILNCEGSNHSAWGCYDVIGTPEEILAMLYNDASYPVAAWNKLYRCSCWENLRFPVGKICEDAFTTYKLIHSAKRIVMISKPLYCYRIRPNSIMTSVFSLKRMDEEEAWRCNYQFVEEYYPKLKKFAFDFYLQRVNGLIQNMTIEDQHKYAEQYKLLRKILKDNFTYVLFRCQLKWKNRIKLGLDIIKL